MVIKTEKFGIPNVFANLCVLAGEGRLAGISNVLARLVTPDQRTEHVVITQTRNTFGNSNIYGGGYAGRTGPYMFECPVALHA